MNLDLRVGSQQQIKTFFLKSSTTSSTSSFIFFFPKLILQILKYTYRLIGNIAKEFGVNSSTINKINTVEAHHRDNIEYPIRDWKSCGIVLYTYEQVTEIIELLKNKKLSINQIAKLYNSNPYSIYGINTGVSKKYRRKNEKYPIRPL